MNYWANQDEILTIYSLRPRDGSGQKNWKNWKGGLFESPFLLKKCVFLEYFDYLSSDWTETLTTNSLKPRMILDKKKFENIQKGVVLYLLNIAFFSNIAIIYDQIEMKL